MAHGRHMRGDRLLPPPTAGTDPMTMAVLIVALRIQLIGDEATKADVIRGTVRLYAPLSGLAVMLLHAPLCASGRDAGKEPAWRDQRVGAFSPGRLLPGGGLLRLPFRTTLRQRPSRRRASSSATRASAASRAVASRSARISAEARAAASRSARTSAARHEACVSSWLRRSRPAAGS